VNFRNNQEVTLLKFNLPIFKSTSFKTRRKEIEKWIKTLPNVRGLTIQTEGPLIRYHFCITKKPYLQYLKEKFFGGANKNPKEDYTIIYMGLEKISKILGVYVDIVEVDYSSTCFYLNFCKMVNPILQIHQKDGPIHISQRKQEIKFHTIDGDYSIETWNKFKKTISDNINSH